MNNLIIVVEGADLVGKSTVINEVRKKLPEVIRVKFDRIPDDLEVNLRTDNSFGKIMRYADDTVYKVISQIKDKIFMMDRFIVSELIYTKLLKRKSYETIENILNKEMTIIILTASEDVIRERIRQRYEDIFKIDEILKINNFFFNFYLNNIGKIQNFFYFENNNQNDLLNITKFIIRKINYDRKS